MDHWLERRVPDWEVRMSARCEDCGRERYSLKRVREILGGDGLRLDLMATANNLCMAADKGNDTAVALCLTITLARERAAREAAERQRDEARGYRTGHPGMCCGQCSDQIAAAEAATVAAQARAETLRAALEMVGPHLTDCRCGDGLNCQKCAALRARRAALETK